MRIYRESDLPKSFGTILYASRWAVIFGVLLAVELQFATARVQRTQILMATLAMAVLTLTVRAVWRGRGNQLLLTIVDVVTVSVLVLFSDGVQSPFYPLFYVTLISAAINFGLRGGLIWASVITTLSFAAEAADLGQRLTEPRVIEDFVRTTPYLFLVAIITGAL